jgi:hypothetical protein
VPKRSLKPAVGQAERGQILNLRVVQEIGLLEQAVLLLQGPGAGRRELRASTGEPVGFARRQRMGWWPWSRRILTVHEQDDEPLLFTVRRSLSLTPSFRVFDADDELVGTVALPWILDRWGQPEIELVTLPEGGGEFRTGTGEVLAEWAQAGDIVRLGLHEPALADPFLKMLLLAAMLHVPVSREEGAR